MSTIIDPSAASFIALLRKRESRYKVLPADNAVLDGIRETANALENGHIKISPKLKCWKEEIGGYIWDKDCVDDRPVKENDHLMDAMRYFVKTKKVIRRTLRRNAELPNFL